MGSIGSDSAVSEMGSFRIFLCFTRRFHVSEAEPRSDVRDAFGKYAEGGTHMTAEQLRRFLVEAQSDGGATLSDAEKIVDQILQKRHHIAKFKRHSLTLDDFHHFLFSTHLNPPIGLKAHHDMTAPLSHYFIYTGHNSYLSGNQLSSECSDVPIIKSLKRGVRVIELDIWPNSNRDGIHVLHGRRNSRWKCPQAAVIPNFHLPMRSFEVKNRTSAEDIKSLRLITAIKTPYLPDGRFDLEAYDDLMNMQIANGAEGVIVGGTTGEGQLMSWDEHIMLIGHTVNCFGGSIKVIGNTGSNSTREAIHASEQGFAVGMHAALHINPYYGKTSLEGLIAHFDSVLSLGPSIIYNVPSRTGQDIPPHVIHTVAKSANLAGVKECVGNDRVEQYTSQGIAVWSGNDDQCHDSRWSHGAMGVISVTSNLVPGLMRELMFSGKNPSLNEKLLPLMDWLFQEPNPIGLNTALAQLGVVRPIFRLPYVPLPLAKRVEFVNLVKQIGRENFVGEKDVQILDDDDFILVGRY